MPVSAASPDDVAAVNTRVDGHESRLAALESAPSPTVSAAPSAPWVGAYVGDQSTSTPDYLALWKALQRTSGPHQVWRCFDSSVKSDPTACRFHRVPGVLPFYSLKPGSTFATGGQKTAYQAVVSALPPGAFLAVSHEPENDMPGSDFYTLTQRAYDDAKEVRPDVTFCYVAMAYQWGEPAGYTGTVSGWQQAAAYVDMVTIDVYAPTGDFGPMRLDSGFVRWWDEILGPSGKPWGVSERGISGHAGEAARVDILMDDWLHACREGADVFLYWNANWTGGTWFLNGTAEQAALRGIAAQGRAR